MFSEENARYVRMAQIVVFVGVGQALLLILIAISSYPGGTQLPSGSGEDAPTGFSWSNNALSDLGHPTTWNRLDNPTGSLLFNSSLMVLGICLVPLFLGLPLQVTDSSNKLIMIAMVCGFLTILGLFALAFTPSSDDMATHINCLYLCVISLGVAAGLHAATMFTEPDAQIWAIPGAALVVVVGIHLVTGVSPEPVYGEGAGEAQPGTAVLMQKVVGLVALLWFAITAYRTMVFKPSETDDVDQNAADAETDRFMRRLRRFYNRSSRS